MPDNPLNAHSALKQDLVAMQPVHCTEVKAGDFIARTYGGSILTGEVELMDHQTARLVGGATIYLSGNEVQVYILERPKPQLPTEPGSRIVAWELSGDRHPKGVVLTRDGTNRWPWDGFNCSYSDDQIKEWAPLPADHFDELRKDAVK